MSKKKDLRYLALGSVAYGVFAFSGVAYAQETDTDEPVITTETQDEDDDGEARQQKVVVTGSLLRRDEYSSSSPIQVITAETATAEGLIDATDIIQSQSVASGSTQINGNFGGFVVEGGTGVNTISLRGLGAQRTLVIFNGRRIGPSGVQGQVGAVDLNVIPTSAVQRVEILKDGASSIYGSDAVAGVVNVITRRSIDAPELNVSVNLPFEGGGEQWSIDGAYGFNFDRGNAVISASYQKLEPLTFRDRDYFDCPQDYVYDRKGGNRVDVIDPNTGRSKCVLSITDAIDINGGPRLIFDPAIGDFRPSVFAEQELYNEKYRDTAVIPETERASIFATADYNFGWAEFFGDFLYTNRKTEQEYYRQFFPWSSPADPQNPYGAFARPITVAPFNTGVDIDYYSATAGLRGDFGNMSFLDDWTWETAAVYSKSEGDYTRQTFPLNRVVDPIRDGGAINVANGSGGYDCFYIEDQDYANNGLGGTYVPCPVTYDYFSYDFVSGNIPGDVLDFLIQDDSGSTSYDQLTLSGIVTGSLFSLPAGDVGVALGVEYRDYELDDQPGFYSSNNMQWGLSSAGQTAGSDNVIEAFGELEIPLLAGLPFAEELTLNVSGRVFEYDSYGSDSVYKAGLNYQITPAIRVRGTYGTSYRTPALYELFLGNQTSFLGQADIDPCDFSDPNSPPTNANIRQNCLTQVPADYDPFGSSAEIVTGGGAGILDAETSDAMTIGAIYTPTFADLSIAVDYFEIEVNDQIAQLGAGSIVSGCYASDTFPNDALCSLFTRDLDPASPTYLQITDVNDSYVNINSQTSRGLDLTARYEHEFDLGDLIVDLQGTWTFEDNVELFSGTGSDVDENNGTIGDPDFTANSRIQFVRGDVTLNWFTDFVSRTSNDEIFGGSVFTYRGRPDTYFKQYTEPYFLHSASVQYRADDWRMTLGVTNIFDEQPPVVSTGAATRRGSVALVGTQYDYRGRSAFARIQKSF